MTEVCVNECICLSKSTNRLSEDLYHIAFPFYSHMHFTYQIVVQWFLANGKQG